MDAHDSTPDNETTSEQISDVDVVALALCPSHHREGSAGSMTSQDGTVRTFRSPLVPCALHVAQARAAVQALIDARRLPL